jgi:hypothetical protein
VGLGAALVGGAAFASADTGYAGSPAASSSSPDTAETVSESKLSDKGSVASSGGDTKQDDRPSSHVTASGGANTSVSTDAVKDSDVSVKHDAKNDDATASQSGNDRHVAKSASTAPVASTGTAAATSAVSTSSAGGNLATDTEESAATPRAGPLSLVTADSTAQQSIAQESPAEPASWQSLLADIFRALQYTFANKAPTLAPQDGVQNANGKVVGELNGNSNNGFELTYTVTQGPAHGTVTIDQATGRYTYTPDAYDSRLTDSFVITADNGAAAQLPGLLGGVQGFVHGIAQGLGIAQADTVSTTIEVRSWFPYITSGDPTDAQYWAEQNYQNCVLMSVAMIEGQLTKVLPTDQTEQDMIDLASRTPSVVDPSKMMWTGPDALGVKYRDGAELLRMKGFDVDYRYYSDVEYEKGTYAQGQQALTDLKADLAEGKGVLVSVNGKTIWTAEKPGPWNGEFFGYANHAIVVVAVDQTRGVVWINDSGLKYQEIGKGAAVPLGAFMYAWAAGGYLTIASSVKPAEEEQAEEAMLIAA